MRIIIYKVYNEITKKERGDFMDQYDSNVQVIMDFLEAESYNGPAISVHRVCYREFKKYLLECGCEYSQEKGDEWQEKNAQNWLK